MNPGALNRVVTLSQPSRASGSGLQETVTYTDVATVRGKYRPNRPGQVTQAGGYHQVGGSVVTIRRPVQSAGEEVVPDIGWRVTMTEAGTERTLHVDGVVDGDARMVGARFWDLACSDIRIPA